MRVCCGPCYLWAFPPASRKDWKSWVLERKPDLCRDGKKKGAARGAWSAEGQRRYTTLKTVLLPSREGLASDQLLFLSLPFY